LQEIVKQLSTPHYRLAEYLFNFLYNLSGYSETTSMDPGNLAIVFGPNVLRAAAFAELQDTSQILAVVKLLISHAPSIFPSETSQKTPPSRPEPIPQLSAPLHCSPVLAPREESMLKSPREKFSETKNQRKLERTSYALTSTPPAEIEPPETKNEPDVATPPNQPTTEELLNMDLQSTISDLQSTLLDLSALRRNLSYKSDY